MLEEQIKFKNKIHKYKESTKPKNLSKKEKQTLTSESTKKLLKGNQKLLNGFETVIFPTKDRHEAKDIF